jgi:hypothetical protein
MHSRRVLSVQKHIVCNFLTDMACAEHDGRREHTKVGFASVYCACAYAQQGLLKETPRVRTVRTFIAHSCHQIEVQLALDLLSGPLVTLRVTLISQMFCNYALFVSLSRCRALETPAMRPPGTAMMTGTTRRARLGELLVSQTGGQSNSCTMVVTLRSIGAMTK